MFCCYVNDGKRTSAVGEIPINLVLVVQVCICSNGSLTAILQSDPNKVWGTGVFASQTAPVRGTLPGPSETGWSQKGKVDDQLHNLLHQHWHDVMAEVARFTP